MFDSWRSGITLCRRHTTMWSGETNWCHFIFGCLGFASVFAMQVQEAWMANHTEIAGVAADFRGPRKVEPLWAVFLWDVLNFIKLCLTCSAFFVNTFCFQQALAGEVGWRGLRERVQVFRLSHNHSGHKSFAEVTWVTCFSLVLLKFADFGSNDWRTWARLFRTCFAATKRQPLRAAFPCSNQQTLWTFASATWKVMSAVRGMISEGRVCRTDIQRFWVLTIHHRLLLSVVDIRQVVAKKHSLLFMLCGRKA